MPQSCGHGTDSFTSPPKEGIRRIFLEMPEKSKYFGRGWTRELGVPEASMLTARPLKPSYIHTEVLLQSSLGVVRGGVSSMWRLNLISDWMLMSLCPSFLYGRNFSNWLLDTSSWPSILKLGASHKCVTRLIYPLTRPVNYTVTHFLSHICL